MDDQTERVGEYNDLSGTSLAMLQAYEGWYNIVARVVNGDGRTVPISQSQGWVLAQEYLERQFQLGYPRYYPVAAHPETTVGTQARNANELVSPTSIMQTQSLYSVTGGLWWTNRPVNQRGTYSFPIGAHHVWNIIYYENCNSSFSNDFTGHSVYYNGIDASGCGDVTVAISRRHGLTVIDIANDTDSTGYFNVGIAYGLQNGVTTSSVAPISPVFLTMLYFGDRNYIPRDLYDICFPTSPEVDAINYKADRIIELMGQSSVELSSILSKMDSMDGKLSSLNSVLSSVSGQLTNVTQELVSANGSLDDVNANLEIVQGGLDDLNESVQSLTDSSIADDAIVDSNDYIQTEIADNIIDPILDSPITGVSSVEAFVDSLGDASESGKVTLPGIFGADTWDLDLSFWLDPRMETAFQFVRWMIRLPIVLGCIKYGLTLVERTLGWKISDFIPGG